MDLKKLKSKLYLVTINKIPSKHDGLMRRIRTKILRNIFLHIGYNANIRPNIKYVYGSNISIGNESGVGENSFLQDIGKINIGNNVLMGPECMLFTANHRTEKKELIGKQGIIVKDIIIKDDVWIGARSIILPGVTLAEGTVVAAGSIVTKSSEPYSVIGGNPAKIIKYRK